MELVFFFVFFYSFLVKSHYLLQRSPLEAARWLASSLERQRAALVFAPAAFALTLIPRRLPGPSPPRACLHYARPPRCHLGNRPIIPPG